MEFSGQYLTYEEYRGLGGTLDLMPFNLLEFEARRKIDIKTQNRLVNSENIPQNVKLCEFKLINSIEGYTKTLNTIANNGNISSENTDGYSISYMNAGQISNVIASKSSELDDIIRNYLLEYIHDGEHLMYVGVE